MVKFGCAATVAKRLFCPLRSVWVMTNGTHVRWPGASLPLANSMDETEVFVSASNGMLSGSTDLPEALTVVAKKLALAHAAAARSEKATKTCFMLSVCRGAVTEALHPLR